MDIVRMCRMRIRVPDQWWGDYLATLGAARVGEREILALGREVGWDLLAAYTKDWFDYSEKRMIEVVRAMPKGKVTRTSTHDPFPGTPAEGVTIKVTVEVKPEEAMIEVDLRDNPDSMANGLNLSEGCALSAPMVAIFNSIDHTVPKNEGSFRRIKVHLRDGCIAGRPIHPTSCSVATTNIADRVANPVQGAIAELADGLGMAETGAVIPPAIGVVSGVHDGKPFVNEVYLGCTGGAGTPHERRLADHPPRRQCRHVLPGLDRDRRAPPPDLRAPAPAAARHRGRRALPWRGRGLCRVLAGRLRDDRRLCQRRQSQPGLGHARRRGRGSVLAVPPARRRLARAGRPAAPRS